MTTQTQPQRPLPIPDEASAPFFTGAAEGRLMIMRCRDCSAHRYPARDRCDACWSTSTDWVQASGKARLHSWIVFHQIYHPWFADKAPYPVALVELEEGPRVTTTLVDVDTADLRADMPLEAVFERISDTVGLPKFRPAG
jgi:uncharacterized protein